MLSRRSLVIAAGAAALGGGAYLALSPRPDYAAAAAAIRNLPAAAGPDDAAWMVGHAVLAANSHNTQAWKFRPEAGAIAILPDRARATPVVDPDDHHLYASLGCAAENLMLAASALGRPAEAAFSEADGLRVALGSGGAGRDPLFDAIVARQCTRGDYDGRPVPAGDLAALEGAARAAGAEAVFITDRALMDQVLDLVLAGSSAQIADPAFVEELRGWLRFSATEALATGDGLFAACSGNPTMPGWIGRRVFPWVFTEGAENDKIARQVRSSAGLAVITSERNDPAHWVAAGRAYQRLALQATVLGIRHAFINQAVEVPAQRVELAALLGLGERRPDLVVRFGFGPPMPYSMRRPLADVMTARAS